MALTLDGTAGITYPSGGTQTTGTSTPVTVAQGGTGAATLTANNVLLGNGTSAVQVVAPGTNGNLLTSNGTTWVSSTPAGGGVTSLNGQTGAITNTSTNAIGSYFIGFGATTTNYDVGSTIAGSSLNKYSTTSPSALGAADVSSAGFGYVNAFTSAGFSGTWQAMARFGNSTGTAGYAPAGLWVRIS